MGTTTYLVYEDTKSSKYWQVELEGDAFTVRWGRLGTGGQSKRKSFSDSAAAKKEASKLIAKKLAKGYQKKRPPKVGASKGKTISKAPAKAGKAKAAKPKATKAKATKAKATKAKAGKAKATKAKAGKAKSGSAGLMPRLLYLREKEATAISRLLQRGANKKDASALRRRLLDTCAKLLAPGDQPRWISLEDDQGQRVVDLQAPMLWAEVQDGDTFYSSYWEERREPRLVLQSKRTAAQLDRRGEQHEEIKVSDADTAAITDYDPESVLVYTLHWVEPAPGSLAELQKKLRLLAQAACNEIETYEPTEQAVAAPAALAAATNHRGPRRQGYVDADGPTKKPRVLWSSSTGGGGEFGGQPILHEGALLSASSGKEALTAVSLKGKKLWSTDLVKPGNYIQGSLCAHGDLVICSTNRGIHALERRKGKEAWFRPLKQAAAGVVSDGVMLYVGVKGALIALNPASGKTAWKWAAPAAKAAVSTPLLCHGGKLVVWAGEQLLCLQGNGADKPAPKPLWEAAASQWFGLYGWACDDQRCLVLSDPGISAYSLDSGAGLWAAKGSFYCLSISSEVVVAKDSDGYLHGLSSKDGRALWRYATGKNPWSIAYRAPPTLTPKTAYAILAQKSPEATYLVAVNLKSGKPRWKLQAPPAKGDEWEPEFGWSSAPLVHESRIYLERDGLVCVG